MYDKLYCVHMVKYEETIINKRRQRAYNMFSDTSPDIRVVIKSAELYAQTSYADEISVLSLTVDEAVRVK